MAQDAQRVAIVTGAARGIGAATARRLAADGMAVAVLDLDPATCDGTVDAITAGGSRAFAVGADVSQADQVEAAVGKVVAELGPPAVLINNAGVIRDNLLFKMTEDDWDAVLGVHLRGAFLMSRAAQKHMVDQRFGRIVNLSSSSALGNRGQVNYSAAKAGMQGFTKTLAIELGPFGITANAVAPGFIVTDMTAATAARIGMPFEDFQAAAAGQIPVRRVGQPEDVAHVISFLCSEGAGFVSGQVLYVAGGPLCCTVPAAPMARPSRASGPLPSWPAMTRPRCPGSTSCGPASTTGWPGCTTRPASAAWACRARSRPWPTPSSPRPARRTTSRSATRSAWAWRPPRSSRSA